MHFELRTCTCNRAFVHASIDTFTQVKDRSTFSTTDLVVQPLAGCAYVGVRREGEEVEARAGRREDACREEEGEQIRAGLLVHLKSYELRNGDSYKLL